MLDIRSATQDDITAILDLNYKLFEQDYVWDNTLDMGWTHRESTIKFMEKSLLSENDFWVVGLNNKAIVGYMAFSIMSTPDWMDKSLKIAELDHVYIDTDNRGNGLGKMLFEKCQNWSKSRGCNLIKVTASYKNDSAQKFYEKIGFSKSDITMQKRI